MAWIKSYDSIERHPKTIKLRVSLRWSRNEVVGFLHRFWWTVMEYFPTGEISSLSAELMSEMLTMELKHAQDALKALQDVGYIVSKNNKLFISDWWDYAGEYLRKSKPNLECPEELRNNSGVIPELRRSYGGVTAEKLRPR